jgi:hypothetical protein
MHTRDEAWVALDRGFKTFMDTMGQLTEEELTSRPVVGQWTVKDVMAHVWSWVEEANRTVKAWDGRRPWQEDVAYDDEWNERHVREKEPLALIAVVDGLTGAHRRLMHLLDLAEDDALSVVAKAPWGAEITLVEFFYEMAGHYHDHVDDLKSYQEHCLECD